MSLLIASVAVFMGGKASPPEAFTASTAASRSLSQQFPHDISVTLDAEALCPRKSLPQGSLQFSAANPC